MFVGTVRNKEQSFLLKPLNGCTFLPRKKHVVDDITRKIARLRLTSYKCELLQDIFGDEQKKERGIIYS